MATDAELLLLICRIERGQASLEDIARALATVEAAMDRAKQLQDALDAALLAHIRKHGPVVIGCITLYAGYRTTTTALDKLAVLNALLIHTRGDLGETTTYLVAQPYKHGSIRSLLPPSLFCSLFRVETAFHLGRRLMKADMRFVRDVATPEQH